MRPYSRSAVSIVMCCNAAVHQAGKKLAVADCSARSAQQASRAVLQPGTAEAFFRQSGSAFTGGFSAAARATCAEDARRALKRPVSSLRSRMRPRPVPRRSDMPRDSGDGACGGGAGKWRCASGAGCSGRNMNDDLRLRGACIGNITSEVRRWSGWRCRWVVRKPNEQSLFNGSRLTDDE